jgi:peptidoglycan/LPS O-acetylase OafA/YrhL
MQIIVPGDESNPHVYTRLDALTSTRFIAAFAILVFHFGQNLWPFDRWPRFWHCADAAVSYFFCLSGFILAYVYERKHISFFPFVAIRWARIGPVYLLALLLVAAYAVKQDVFSIVDFVLSATLLQAWIPSYAMVLNGPGWSLSDEWFFYLAFPALLAFLLRRRTSWVVAGALSLWFLSAIVTYVFDPYMDNPVLRDFVAFHPLLHLPTFVLGMACGKLYLARSHELRRRHGVLPATCAFAILAPIAISQLIGLPFRNVVLIPGFAAIILYLAVNAHSPLGRLLSFKPLVQLGEISYAIYILQVPIWMIWNFILSRLAAPLSPIGVFWSFVLVLIVLAQLSYRFIELPIRARVKKRISREVTA